MLPAGAALERILEDSGYLALAATSRGGVEAGDLLHAIDRVRAVVEDGFTLAEAADALASWSGLDEDGPEESTEVDSLPLEPGRRDVVRLMNLHKAKGLEAEVVFLADPLGGFDPRVDVRIVREGATPLRLFRDCRGAGDHWDRVCSPSPRAGMRTKRRRRRISTPRSIVCSTWPPPARVTRSWSAATRARRAAGSPPGML